MKQPSSDGRDAQPATAESRGRGGEHAKAGRPPRQPIAKDAAPRPRDANVIADAAFPDPPKDVWLKVAFIEQNRELYVSDPAAACAAVVEIVRARVHNWVWTEHGAVEVDFDAGMVNTPVQLPAWAVEEIALAWNRFEQDEKSKLDRAFQIATTKNNPRTYYQKRKALLGKGSLIAQLADVQFGATGKVTNPQFADALRIDQKMVERHRSKHQAEIDAVVEALRRKKRDRRSPT